MDLNCIFILNRCMLDGRNNTKRASSNIWIKTLLMVGWKHSKKYACKMKLVNVTLFERKGFRCNELYVINLYRCILNNLGQCKILQ